MNYPMQDLKVKEYLNRFGKLGRECWFQGQHYVLKSSGYFKNCVQHGTYLHIAIWEFHNGPVPPGFEIHHKDGNRSNNDILNLETMSSRQHTTLHIRQRFASQDYRQRWSERLKKLNADAEKIERPCSGCGKPIEYLASQATLLRFKNVWCSDRCRGAAYRLLHPRPRKKIVLVDVICDRCGCSFLKSEGRVMKSSNRGHRHNFCSKACNLKAFHANKKLKKAKLGLDT